MHDLVKRILDGDMRALARAATAVENRSPEVSILLKELSPFSGRARVLGITGPPGAGKSTLVDQMTRLFREEKRTVGIITVDPSSPFSGGAILGDRIRMQEHHADAGVFIRSMATRGSLGGLARATADMARLLDGAGRDVILIETVGVGQDEVEVVRLADITIVVLVPGMGDDVQAIKAGIMEIADIFVINKADHPGAERVEREVQGVLTLAKRPDGWVPPIVRTVASEGAGVRELLGSVQTFEQFTGAVRRRSLSPDESSDQFGIDHLGIAVPSLEGALHFWEEELGLRAREREAVPLEKVSVAMLPVGGPRIELLEPTEPDSVIGRFLKKHGAGIHHVALRVPDLEAAVARLRATGARVLSEPRSGAGGRLYVFVHPASTGGVLLELIQQKEEPEN
jgi:LAO/AO transport system kinase